MTPTPPFSGGSKIRAFLFPLLLRFPPCSSIV